MFGEIDQVIFKESVLWCIFKITQDVIHGKGGVHYIEKKHAICSKYWILQWQYDSQYLTGNVVFLYHVFHIFTVISVMFSLPSSGCCYLHPSELGFS